MTERARMLTKSRKHSDDLALTKNVLIAVWKLWERRLALSGAFAPAPPEGEPQEEY